MHLTRPTAAFVLLVACLGLSSCGGGVPGLTRSLPGAGASGPGTTLDLGQIRQVAMPQTARGASGSRAALSTSAPCLSVTQVALSQNTAWWIAGSFAIVNGCATAQSASGLQLLMQASTALTASAFTLNALSFPVWQPTTATAVGVSGNPDAILITLTTTGMVPPGGSVPGSFGYNPAGKAVSGLSLAVNGATSVQSATLSVALDSSSLTTVCTATAPCSIPITLTAGGGQPAVTVATITNGTLGKSTITVTNLDPGTYTIGPSSLPANVGATITPAATFTVVAGASNSVSLTFAPKPTGSLTLVLADPDAATFKQSGLPVTVTSSGGSTIVAQTTFGTAATIANLTAGSYGISAPGLASASAGEYYAYPATSASVTANATTNVGTLKATALTNLVADTFTVTGLAPGDSVTFTFTDDLEGTSFTFNQESLTSTSATGTSAAFKFPSGDDVTVTTTVSAKYQSVAPFTIAQGTAGQTYTIALTPPVVTTSGTLYYHFYVPQTSTAGMGEYLTLAGDNYTDLMMSNFVAGVMLGHTLTEFYPGIQFEKDYLYGTLLGQLLQENIETALYSATSTLIDPSPNQSAVMGTGQGGPYQINNYDVDMVDGSTTPGGYSLINYIAIQNDIGFTFAQSAAQFASATPASFNNKYYGPMLTTYFHLNDARALYALGQTTWSPTPDYTGCLANLAKTPNAPLDVLINYAYNQGYYGGLLANATDLCVSNLSTFVTTMNSYGNAGPSSGSGVNTYAQYPYQVRFYLDELYDQSSLGTTIHVAFNTNTLGGVFADVMQTLAYVNGAGQYGFIPGSAAATAYSAALKSANVTPGTTLDVSNAANRATLFAVLESAIGNLETSLGTNFSKTTATQL